MIEQQTIAAIFANDFNSEIVIVISVTLFVRAFLAAFHRRYIVRESVFEFQHI